MKANDVTYAHMLSSDHLHFFDPDSLADLLRRYSEHVSIERSDPIYPFWFAGPIRALLRSQIAVSDGPLETSVLQSTLCCCEHSPRLISISGSSAVAMMAITRFETILQTIDWFDEIHIELARPL